MSNPTEWTEIEISAQQSLRFECVSSTTIKLVQGTAEISGAELSSKREHILPISFGGTIVSFTGCTLKYSPANGLSKFFVNFSEDLFLPNIYLNFHAALERDRSVAVDSDSRGPRIMICGNESAGKTTVCRTLVNYAARNFRRVIYVDANVGMNELSLVPGTIAAAVIAQPGDIVTGWSGGDMGMVAGTQRHTTSDNGAMIVFNYGQHLCPIDNVQLFSMQLATLAESVNIRAENDPDVFAGGCVINISGVRNSDVESRKLGCEAIRAAVIAFEVNVLVIIQDGFLEKMLETDLPDFVSVVRIPQSSGVQARTIEQKNRKRSEMIRTYFHGTSEQRLQAHKLNLMAENYKIFKIDLKKSSSAMNPLHEDCLEEEWCRVTEVPIDIELTHRVLAISEATDTSEIPGAPVLGFLCVLNVSADNSSFSVLSPSDLPPPNNILLLNCNHYVDQ